MSPIIEKDIPKPSSEQMAWQDMEIGMFFHFDIVTYAPNWNFRTWRDIPPPEIYNPVDLDTDQWMEAAKAIGAKYAVFVAKHCSGFLQWQSDLYPYSVKQSKWRNGKGDVVKDFVESCRKYGIKPGIYASVTANGFLEVDNPGIVNGGKGGDQEKQENYVRICEGMLTELWSRYGELTEVWFDGGALPPEKGGPDMIPILKKFQPNAIVFQGPAANIRWIGNESGVAGYPCWATVPDLNSQEDHKMLPNGDPEGKIWMPGECDVPIRNHQWFWTPGHENLIYPLDALMDMYYRSVGRNCNLLLNANPDPRGLVPEADFNRYVEFGREIRRRFDSQLAEVKGESELLELDLGRTVEIDHAIIMEDIKHGERVRKYVVEALGENQTWQKICEGISIGHKRIEKFSPVKTSRVRLIITESIARPMIRRFAIPWDAGAISIQPEINIIEDERAIKIETDKLEAVIPKNNPKHWMTGIEKGSFLDKATGFCEIGDGLMVIDWLMEAGSDEAYSQQVIAQDGHGVGRYTWYENETDPERRLYSLMAHGSSHRKRMVEGPQLCHRMKPVQPELIRGKDFVAVKTTYQYEYAAPGRKPGSRWTQLIVFPKGERFFILMDKIDSVNDSEEMFLRGDMPGCVRHDQGDTFSEMYLSYLSGPKGVRIPSSEFFTPFPPDLKFGYRRDTHRIPEHFIRAYHLRDKDSGKDGPWLAGMTLEPSVVYEAWCSQRPGNIIVMIEEIHGRPVKAGESFSAAHIVGYFDSIEEMHNVYDRYKGHSALIADTSGWHLE